MRRHHGGAQERSVPSRNGCVPVGPGGRHNIQAGATLDAAADGAVVDAAGDGDALTPAAVALDKPGADADADVPAAAEAVVAAVCATAGPASAIGNADAMHSRMAGDRLPMWRGVMDQRLSTQ